MMRFPWQKVILKTMIDSQSCDDHQPQEQSDLMEQDGDEPNGGNGLESCLQPTDVSEEILSFSVGIYSVAPAEGNKPVRFFRTPKNALDENRPIKLTPCSYFKTRLCTVDNRFARDTNYLFFAQKTEIHGQCMYNRWPQNKHEEKTQKISLL